MRSDVQAATHVHCQRGMQLLEEERALGETPAAEASARGSLRAVCFDILAALASLLPTYLRT